MFRTILSLLIILSVISLSAQTNEKVSKIYYESGKLKTEGIYNEDGLKQGEWKTYYENGAIKSIKIFSENKLDGTTKWYHKNGNLSQIVDYKNGKPVDGSAKFYHENGALWMQDKEINGTKVSYQDNGQIQSEGKYSNYFPVGIHKTYYPNGQLESIGTYENGSKEGEWKFYNEDGTKKESLQYSKNQIKSDKVEYYSNGQIKEKGKYQEQSPSVLNPDYVMVTGILNTTNLKEGEWIGYHNNGKISYRGSYLQGAKVGTWKFYDADGTLVEEIPTFFGHLFKDIWDSPYGLNQLAWKCYEKYDDEQSLHHAERAILRAMEIKKKYEYIDTYAHILFKLKKYQEAFHWSIIALEYAKKEKKRSSYTTRLLSDLEKHL